MSSTEHAPPPKNIGGWLILVGIGLVISPFQLLFLLNTNFVPLFRDGTLEYLINPIYDSYHPFWGPLIYGEVFINILILCISFLLIYLFFTKSYRFPHIYIFLKAFSLVFVIVDTALLPIVVPTETVFTPETIGEIIGVAISAAIWIPYMLVSVRVNETFVDTRADASDASVIERF